MGFFSREPYDRVRVLAKADRARARGRLKKAIAGYRQVLEKTPSDHGVRGKVAPLLARTGQHEEALRSFEVAAKGHIEAGFVDRGLAIYVQAAEHYPQRPFFWEETARLHLLRGTKADAANALVEGGQHVGSEVPVGGERLLRRALEIDPWHLDGRLALARVLRRQGKAEEARTLLEKVVPRLAGRELRRVRGALWRLGPTPAATWRWLRAAVVGR